MIITLVGSPDPDDLPEISEEEAELLADAAWATDYLTAEDFAELQTLGALIIAEEEG